MWEVEVVEGYPADLAKVLQRLTDQGYAIRFVNPNGINRWTVCAWKDE